MSVKKINEKLFLANFFLYCFITLLDSSLYSTGTLVKIDKYMSIFCCFLTLLLMMVENKIKVKSIILILIAFAILCAVAMLSDRTSIIIVFNFFICSKVTNFNRITKTCFVANFSCIIFVMFSCLVGILPDITYAHESSIAHSFGFSYYSNYAYPIMFISIMYMFLRKKEISCFELLFIEIANYLTYIFSSTRLAFILSTLDVISYIIIVKWHFFKKRRKLTGRITKIAFPLATLICYLMMVFYDKQNLFWRYIDNLLSGRLEIGHNALLDYHITIFGQPVIMIGNAMIEQGLAKPWEYFYIDSGFLYSLVVYGLLFTIGTLIIYSFIYYYAWFTSQKVLVIWITTVLFFMFINNCWISINQNPLILCFFTILSSSKLSSNAIHLCKNLKLTKL